MEVTLAEDMTDIGLKTRLHASGGNSDMVDKATSSLLLGSTQVEVTLSEILMRYHGKARLHASGGNSPS